MATSFPTGLDALTNPTSADGLNSPDHAGQHANVNDAVEALEAKVGVNGSAVTSSLDYMVAASKVVTDKVDPASASTNQVLKFNGTKFVPATGASVTVSDTPPTSPTPQAGDQWYESDTGRQFIYYGTAWIEIGNATDVAGALQPGQVTALSAVTTLTSDDVFPVVDNPASATATNKITADSLASQLTQFAPQTSFRNKAINGGFDIWQRGTSFSNPTSGSYISDRASIIYDGSGATRTISRGQFDPYVSGASITATPPTGTSPTYFLRYNQSVAGSGASYNIIYINRTEDVRVLAGKTVTVSFYAKAAANLTIGGVYFEQVFGSGGSPSSNVYSTISNSTSVTTSWQRFSYTVAVPSASGKVIGSSDNSSYTGILMYLPINTTFTLDIWGLQVEQGSVATPFEQRPIQTELALCQRYYEQERITLQTMYWASDASGSVYGQSFIFSTPKRAAPTIRTYDAANTIDRHSTFNAGATRTDGRTNNLVDATSTGFSVRGYNVAGAYGYGFYWTADSEL